MKKYKILVKLLFAMGVVFSVFSTTARANEDDVGFQIRPLLPSTQIDREKGYYYVETKPGENQTLELSVMSTVDKEMTIIMSVDNAFSQSTGNIGYTDDLELIHESLKNPMTEILKPQTKEFILKPNSEEIVKFDLTPPNEHYEGVKIGRISIQEKPDKEATGIRQEYQYSMGVITSESGLAYDDGNTLELEKVQANISNGDRVVEAFIVNPQPKTIENLKVRSYVTAKGDNKKVKERNIDNFAFAPNSRLKFMIPWALTDFKAGEYTFHYEAKNEYESFHLQENFTIRSSEASKLNDDAAFVVETPFYIKIIIGVLNSVLLGLIVIIINRDKKWVKEIKARRKNRGRKKGNKVKSKRNS